jgi:ribosome recycling factor
MISVSDLNDNINPKNFEKLAEKEFAASVSFLEKELQKIRTNRAHPSLIEDIKVMLYGDLTPLKHIAHITCSDTVTISVQPFDRSTIGEIEKALSQSDIGLNPKNDGVTIKITLPTMSKERRAELIKQVGKKKEEALIQGRTIRQDITKKITESEKKKQISEDTSKKLQKSLQTVFDKINNDTNSLAKKKESQINE